MIAAARPRGLDAKVMDARALAFENEFDAVFSNAVLHRIRDDPDAPIASAFRALWAGGRFVGELAPTVRGAPLAVPVQLESDNAVTAKNQSLLGLLAMVRGGGMERYGLVSFCLPQSLFVAYAELLTLSVWHSEQALARFPESQSPTNTATGDHGAIQLGARNYTILTSGEGQLLVTEDGPLR